MLLQSLHLSILMDSITKVYHLVVLLIISILTIIIVYIDKNLTYIAFLFFKHLFKFFIYYDISHKLEGYNPWKVF